MVVRIHNTGKWKALQPGAFIASELQHGRVVKVEVNCLEPTRFDVVEGDKVTFVAIVQGYEKIEYTAEGESYLGATTATEDGEVWYFTNDGDQLSVENPSAVSFTKIASRRTRNPELERMMFKMEQNMMRRVEKQFAEAEAIRVARELANPPHDPETGEIEEDDDDQGAAGGIGATEQPAAGGVAAPAAEGKGLDGKPGA